MLSDISDVEYVTAKEADTIDNNSNNNNIDHEQHNSGATITTITHGDMDMTTTTIEGTTNIPVNQTISQQLPMNYLDITNNTFSIQAIESLCLTNMQSDIKEKIIRYDIESTAVLNEDDENNDKYVVRENKYSMECEQWYISQNNHIRCEILTYLSQCIVTLNNISCQSSMTRTQSKDSTSNSDADDSVIVCLQCYFVTQLFLSLQEGVTIRNFKVFMNIMIKCNVFI
jgi:hypothetical protein